MNTHPSDVYDQLDTFEDDNGNTYVIHRKANRLGEDEHGQPVPWRRCHLQHAQQVVVDHGTWTPDHDGAA